MLTASQSLPYIVISLFRPNCVNICLLLYVKNVFFGINPLLNSRQYRLSCGIIVSFCYFARKKFKLYKQQSICHVHLTQLYSNEV